MPECSFRRTPSTVTIVRYTDDFVSVSSLKREILFRNSSSYLGPIANGADVNFISQRLMTPSFRSITRSACAPPDLFSLRHDAVLVRTPPMRSASLICRSCQRQTRSNANPDFYKTVNGDTITVLNIKYKSRFRTRIRHSFRFRHCRSEHPVVFVKTARRERGSRAAMARRMVAWSTTPFSSPAAFLTCRRSVPCSRRTNPS